MIEFGLKGDEEGNKGVKGDSWPRMTTNLSPAISQNRLDWRFQCRGQGASCSQTMLPSFIAGHAIELLT